MYTCDRFQCTGSFYYCALLHDCERVRNGVNVYGERGRGGVLNG